jgi:Ca2+/Na+ antiporter
MGESMSKLFVPLHSLPGLYALPAECVTDDDEQLAVWRHPTAGGLAQLGFLAGAYAAVLMKASKMISDGSELLLLLPEIAPIVGSVVIPILGAVPDGAIVLFSGLGPNAQKQLSVGVGALAGSTIMLLTVPFFMSVAAGRVGVERGACTYARAPGTSRSAPFSKLPELRGWRAHLEQAGVEADPRAMRGGVRAMLLTSLSYVLIQFAAFAFAGRADIAQDEAPFALAALCTCVLCFAGYLFVQIRGARHDAVLEIVIDRAREEGIRSGLLSLQGAFYGALTEAMAEDAEAEVERGESQAAQHGGEGRSPLVHHVRKNRRFEAVVRRFFHQFDHDGNGELDHAELKALLGQLHVPNSPENVAYFLHEMDKDGNASIHFDEFLECMTKLVLQQHGGFVTRPSLVSSNSQRIEVIRVHHERRVASAGADNGGGDGRDQAGSLVEPGSAASQQRGRRSSAGAGADADAGVAAAAEAEEEEEEEEEQPPDDLADLPADTQRRRIILRSLRLMFTGTALVLLFSDPMVDVLSEVGEVLHISPFYVSFVLAPLASNASEFIASYAYAQKKSRKTITISLTSLLGAATMNNSFCLAIFMLIIWARGLAWEFSAETIAILFVELSVAAIAWRRVITLKHACLILALFPASLLLVFTLENVAGLK